VNQCDLLADLLLLFNVERRWWMFDDVYRHANMIPNWCCTDWQIKPLLSYLNFFFKLYSSFFSVAMLILIYVYTLIILITTWRIWSSCDWDVSKTKASKLRNRPWYHHEGHKQWDWEHSFWLAQNFVFQCLAPLKNCCLRTWTPSKTVADKFLLKLNIQFKSLCKISAIFKFLAFLI